MVDKPEKQESKVELAKRESRHLRGTIADTLASDETHFDENDVQVLKFHGVYQQDDRDIRKERRAQGLDKAYNFMIRCAIPAGLLTADQYLALDKLADEYGSGSLRVTTRQGFQFHGVLKENLKTTIAGIHGTLLTTLSACGDVQRNVMGCPAPLRDEAHVALRQVAKDIAAELRPKTPAYHEIWLDGEKQISTDQEEPFYDEVYLPRKFKTGIGLINDNCIDLYTYDLGFIALVEQGTVVGYNVLIGGGMGMTHNKADTFARIAEPLGFVDPDYPVEAARTVASIFLDHGNRADRRHARLKYLLADWGIERFREEFRRRVSFELRAWRPIPRPVSHDHLGRHPQDNGKHFYGIYIENGRIIDRDDVRIKTALREVVSAHRPGLSLTPHQNVLLTGLDESAVDEVERALINHGITPATELSGARRFSMACPAFPTCGLALADSERRMPDVVRAFEKELESLGLRDVPITLRMTGCPNGCTRPYTADIAFVGRRPEVYRVYVGGGLRGDRVADLFASDVETEDLVPALRPLLTSWAKNRENGESLSDYYQRRMNHTVRRTSITGREEPTAKRLQLEVE